MLLFVDKKLRGKGGTKGQYDAIPYLKIKIMPRAIKYIGVSEIAYPPNLLLQYSLVGRTTFGCHPLMDFHVCIGG